MAEEGSHAYNSQESCERKEVVEKSCACDKCLEVELQLKEALLEPSYAQVIIGILRKGQSVGTCIGYISNSTSTTYEVVDQEVNTNLEIVNSRHLCEPKKLKETAKHVTFPNSKISVTSNRYSVLADISESGRYYEVLVSTEEQDKLHVIDKHPSGANKPKTTPAKQIWGGHNLTILPHNLQDRERKNK